MFERKVLQERTASCFAQTRTPKAVPYIVHLQKYSELTSSRLHGGLAPSPADEVLEHNPCSASVASVNRSQRFVTRFQRKIPEARQPVTGLDSLRELLKGHFMTL